jgi:hypothetical protein
LKSTICSSLRTCAMVYLCLKLEREIETKRKIIRESEYCVKYSSIRWPICRASMGPI